jgi:hypothetical protein
MIQKFKYFKKLSILGIFKTFDQKINKNNLYYNYYLSYYSDTIYSTSTVYLIKYIYKIYPLVSLLFLKENLFLFVNVDQGGGRFLTKFIYSLIKKIKIFCSYDWGFGSLTNFNRIFYKFFLGDTKHFYHVPTIVIFLRMLEKEHYIVPEAQRVGALSLGPSDYGISGCIDYPVPMNATLDYSYFFLKFFILSFNNNINSINFIKNYNESFLK